MLARRFSEIARLVHAVPFVDNDKPWLRPMTDPGLCCVMQRPRGSPGACGGHPHQLRQACSPFRFLNLGRSAALRRQVLCHVSGTSQAAAALSASWARWLLANPASVTPFAVVGSPDTPEELRYALCQAGLGSLENFVSVRPAGSRYSAHEWFDVSLQLAGIWSLAGIADDIVAQNGAEQAQCVVDVTSAAELSTFACPSEEEGSRCVTVVLAPATCCGAALPSPELSPAALSGLPPTNFASPR